MLFIFVCLPFFLFLFIFFQSYTEGTLDSDEVIFLVLFLVFFVGGPLLLGLIFETIRYFLSYLIISQNGIEYRHWPITWHRIKWEDVERIVETKWLGLSWGDVIYIKDAEIIGTPLWPWINRQLGWKPDYSIYLSNRKRKKLYGWPDGPLANDLRKYAPHLFNSEELEPSSPNT